MFLFIAKILLTNYLFDDIVVLSLPLPLEVYSTSSCYVDTLYAQYQKIKTTKLSVSGFYHVTAVG